MKSALLCDQTVHRSGINKYRAAVYKSFF